MRVMAMALMVPMILSSCSSFTVEDIYLEQQELRSSLEEQLGTLEERQRLLFRNVQGVEQDVQLVLLNVQESGDENRDALEDNLETLQRNLLQVKKSVQAGQDDIQNSIHRGHSAIDRVLKDISSLLGALKPNRRSKSSRSFFSSDKSDDG